MFDSRLLVGQNECPYTGLESPVHDAKLSGIPGIKAWRDHVGTIRLVYRGQSGLLLGRDVQGNGYTIKAVYTDPAARRYGYARCLLWVARNVLGVSVRHSQNMTDDGKAWAHSVG